MIDFTQFAVQPHGDDYEVFDVRSGRPVDIRPSRRSANGVAYRMNQAAAEGRLISTLSGPSNPRSPKEPNA